MSTPRLFALLTFIILGLACQATAAESHRSLVQLKLDVPGGNEFIMANGGHLDIIYVKPGSFARIAVDQEELEFLRESGLPLEILEENLESVVAYPNTRTNYGIYHTWSETVAFVDSLRLLYPNVISEKWSIGQSHQGRDLWAFRISDNPDIDEDEPEVFIDAMHHAREIMSSEFTIMFAEYLAQGYGVDPEITWLVNNRELYIVPVVNPDGSVYNESTNPSGGGYWRKNRRNNGDGSYGVDPNRNYPYQWGFDNDGSSGDPDSEVYRGPSPGSEPEIQAMMNFIDSRNFRTHDTVHTYGNLTLFPWGYTQSPTADDAIFRHMGDEMVKYNGYDPGQPFEAINYMVNGGTFDWVYGDQTFHDLIYTFSNEIGNSGDGFWPSEARRQPLFEENIWPHIYLMRAAGTFVEVHSPVVTTGVKNIDPGQTGTLDFTIENQGVFDATGSLTLTVRTDDPWVQFGSATRVIGGLGIIESTTLGGNPIPLTVDPACPNGHLVNFTVTVNMPGGDLVYSLGFAVGSPTALFSDDMENGSGNWTTTGQWGLTTGYSHSPTHSLTDSPNGDYSDETSTSATLNQTFNATSLSFWHRDQIEEGWDYGRVQISGDGGPWTTIQSYTGFSGWLQETLDLSEFAGQELAIRFVLDTDQSVREDGWFIDDVVVTGNLGSSLAMGAPIPVSPGEGETVGSTPTFTVAPGAKAFAEPVVYGFRIYTDELCTDLIAGADNVPEDGSQTSWTSPVLANGDYWWRAWAGDGVERTDLSQPVGFTVSGVSGIGDVVIGRTDLRILGSVTGSQSRLELSLPGQADVSVDIYDARGARVRQLFSGTMNSGTRVLVWDGKDNTGQSVASGIYFVRMNTGREALTDRVVIVR